MKLSSKFFCIAYIIVLLSMGLGGTYIIKNISDALWNTQTERADIAVNYAAESFLAFTDVTSGEITAAQKSSIIRQIKSFLDDTVTKVEIYTSKTVEREYSELRDNQILSQYIKNNDLLLMKSVCKLSAGSDIYYLAVYSDFTSINKQCEFFWNSYAVAAFSVSVISGLLLFVLAKRITKPLNTLTKVTDEIALGNYGKKVDIKNTDYEISNLSNSFNAMSSAVEQKINEIKEETKKRDIFVADFTHEMKTPMTAIIGYSQMLKVYDLSSDEKMNAAVAIHSEAKRLEKLSLQLLDLYVFKNEQIEMEQINLFDVGKQLNTTIKYLSEKYDVSYSVDFDNETVCANSVLLLSLLYNLADNAFKASSPHSSIKIYSESYDNCITIFVEDKGKGIAKENVKYLTEPFYREDKSRSRTLGGAGLGLSLCKEIARLHETELCFESEEGKGTTVTFTLKKGGEKK